MLTTHHRLVQQGSRRLVRLRRGESARLPHRPPASASPDISSRRSPRRTAESASTAPRRWWPQHHERSSSSKPSCSPRRWAETIGVALGIAGNNTAFLLKLPVIPASTGRSSGCSSTPWLASSSTYPAWEAKRTESDDSLRYSSASILRKRIFKSVADLRLRAKPSSPNTSAIVRLALLQFQIFSSCRAR